MCGITGIVAFDEIGIQNMQYLDAATDSLINRGPDSRGVFRHKNVGLGHRRLSIIDVSHHGAQPMTDPSGRYTIVYNGEIYNFKLLRKNLQNAGITFQSESDTEVLLHAFIHKKIHFLNELNGFFSFAIYDKEEDSLFICRDRVGIKPLYVYKDDHQLIFASELKAIFAYNIHKELDHTTLYQYMQHNYVAGPSTILKNVIKLEPGATLELKDGKLKKDFYYEVPFHSEDHLKISYEEQQKYLFEYLEKSVQDRLIADVPVGAFLSGGIDSSVIVALAARHTDHLKTFSIGFKDQPFFDETEFAQLVANRHKTDHTVFSLSNDDLFEDLHNVLDYIDEPFADSSALAVHILTQKVSPEVKVALSGDGADELFAGYNKHFGEFRIEQSGPIAKAISVFHPLWRALPKSRNSKTGNLFRQLDRFSEGMRMDKKERYWRWCGFIDETRAFDFFTANTQKEIDLPTYLARKSRLLEHFTDKKDINEILYADMELVLQNDMLTKVDMMSMANSLEVRVPFLDHKVIEFAFSIPESSKINETNRKMILKDAFKHMLPRELYNRPKHGFEVPLLGWFKSELKSMIFDDLLDRDFVREQNIFDPLMVEQLKTQLMSSNPGDATARIWGLVVFQYWYKKWMK